MQEKEDLKFSSTATDILTRGKQEVTSQDLAQLDPYYIKIEVQPFFHMRNHCGCLRYKKQNKYDSEYQKP